MLRMSQMVFCILVSTLLLTMTACSSLRTHSDYDPDARFDNYTTFAWMGDADVVQTEAPDDGYISPLNVQRIERAIENELTTHGYRQLANPDDADFLVTFTVGTRDRIYVERYPLAYRDRWIRHWPYYYSGVVDVHEYTEGMLAIDIFDRLTMHPVWHGVARKRIRGADTRDPEPQIKRAVTAILGEFPPL